MRHTDILLDRNGDIVLSNSGDIQLTESVRQQIQIRLRWFAREWRWRPETGIDYYGKILIKNASDAVIKREVRKALEDVKGIVSITISIEKDRRNRKAKIVVIAETAEETIREEVGISG